MNHFILFIPLTQTNTRIIHGFFQVNRCLSFQFKLGLQRINMYNDQIHLLKSTSSNLNRFADVTTQLFC